MQFMWRWQYVPCCAFGTFLLGMVVSARFIPHTPRTASGADPATYSVDEHAFARSLGGHYMVKTIFRINEQGAAVELEPTRRGNSDSGSNRVLTHTSPNFVVQVGPKSKFWQYLKKFTNLPDASPPYVHGYESETYLPDNSPPFRWFDCIEEPGPNRPAAGV